MGTLNVKVDGSGYFTFHVAPEANFGLEPLDLKSRAAFIAYIETKHALPAKLFKRLKRSIYLHDTVSGRTFGTCMGCANIFCFFIPVLGSPDQSAWDLDVDNNTLRLHITEQLASVLPVGSWQLIESVQVGTPWAEGRTLFKLYIIDPTRREA